MPSTSNQHFFEMDPQELYARAQAGDAAAQRGLAVRLNDGVGIPQDQAAAESWLKKAAEGGDTFAQTQYARILRFTKQPEKEREAVAWLKRAVGQGDIWAQYELGLHQVLGAGTEVDLVAGNANIIMASLLGLDAAKEMLATQKAEWPATSWAPILDHVDWPNLILIMGPMLDGHLEGWTKAREQDDGTDDAEWMRYERESAELTFKGSGSVGSILDVLFDCPVQVTDWSVTRADLDGQIFAAIIINMRNIRDASGLPVFFRPRSDMLEAFVPTLALLNGRKWIGWCYGPGCASLKLVGGGRSVTSAARRSD